MSVTKEDYLRKQEVLKLWGQIVDLFATKSSVTTLQGYFTDGKAKKAIADGDGNTISSTYLKKSGGVMNNNAGIGWKNAGGTNVNNLLSYNTSNVFVIGYSQSTVGATKIFGKTLSFMTNGDTERLGIADDGKVTIAGQLQLGSTTGTAPLIISSTTLVTNLNADLLDGHNATYFGYNMGQDSYDCNEVGTHFAAYRFGNAPLNAFPNAAWSNMLVIGNGLDTMTQIGGPYSAQELYFRNGNWKNDGTGSIRTESWHRIWHDGNDGSDSGLDADLLDGQHGSYYAVKSTTEGAIDVLASGLGQLTTMTNDNKQVIDAQGDNIRELYGYFDSGVAKNASRLTTVSKTAWGKTFWTANGVPDSISGDMTNVGDVKINNDKGIYIKDYGGTHREVLKLDYTDLLSIGYETGLAGYDTFIWGSQVVLSAHDGTEYQNIVTAKVENGTNKLEVGGNLILTKSSYTSNGLSLDASGNMKVSDGARLTDIYGSAIKFYIGSSEAAAIDSANKNLTSQGSVIGLRGVAAYGIADLSIISNS